MTALTYCKTHFISLKLKYTHISKDVSNSMSFFKRGTKEQDVNEKMYLVILSCYSQTTSVTLILYFEQ